jgi:hypothetical protein
LLDGNDSTGHDNDDSSGNNKEAICGKEEPSAKATAKDDNDEVVKRRIRRKSGKQK